MLAFLQTFARIALLPVAIAYGSGITIEKLASRKSPSWFFNCCYAVFFQAFSMTAVLMFTYAVTAPIERLPYRGLIHVQWHDNGSVVIGALLAFLGAGLTDFCYYWFHRFQHTSRWLWQEHAFHHSDPSMNVTTAWRQHWLEMPMQTLGVIVPGMLLFKLPIIAVSVSVIVRWVLEYIIHLNVRLSFGPFLVGPDNHRIHHSRLPQHVDKNFSAVLPLWDILFGTYYAERGECPPTGLCSGERIETFSDALSWPFVKWKKMLQGRP